MRGLLRRLADLDGEAERGVAIVDFFDQLLLHRADLESLVRATATLAGCPAGAVDHRLCLAYRVDLDTGAFGGECPPATAGAAAAYRAAVQVGGDCVGEVWLEGEGADHPWQDLILERMAITAASIHERIRAVHANDEGGLADPGIVELLLGRATNEVDRSRAAGLLGLLPGAPVRVVAVVATQDLAAGLPNVRSRVAALTGGRVVGAALTGQMGVLLIPRVDCPAVDLPDTVVAAVGPPATSETADRSWRAARRAVRFAGMSYTWPRWLAAADLGGTGLLADLPAEQALAEPDVLAVARLACGSGSVSLAVLEHFCFRGSVREAAAAVHMHHSSAAYRLQSASTALGFDVTCPQGRRRAEQALTLWHLHRPRDLNYRT